MLYQNDFPMSMKADMAVAFEEGRIPVAQQEWRQLCEIVPTTSSAKKEVFYGDVIDLRRFRSERQPHNFWEYCQTITLDDWELTRTVKRTVMDDDQSGGYIKDKIRDFGHQVDVSRQRLAEEHLRRGTSYRCFDTNMFFSINHVYTDCKGASHGPTAPQANFHVGGSQVAASTVQRDASWFAHLVSDRSHPLGAKMTHIGVRRGTDNHKNAMELANSQYTVEVSTVKGTFTENVFKGAYGIIPFDYGIGDSEWYSFDLSQASRKPIKILSHSISPGFDNLEYTQLLEDSDTGFWRNEFAFGVWGRFGFNPGDWRTAYLHGTTTWVDPDDDDFERRPELWANAV